MAPGTNSHCLVTSHAFRYVHKGPGYFWNGCIVSQTWSARDVGPNITGRLFDDAGFEDSIFEGAFYQYSTGNFGLNVSKDRDNPFLYFDASRVNELFGKSSSVQPNAICFMPCIKF